MNILLVEDNPLDAELTQVLLKEAWPAAAIDVVHGRHDFLQLIGRPHDVVLSDFSMGNFDGLEALALAREKAPKVPFIFFSGTIGEDRALEALRAGANDYLLKDRPKRLISAIERAVKEASLRAEQEAAAEQVLKVQRLENIGMLAAGIAHDFNNVLAPVLMGVSLLRMELKEERQKRILSTIQSSAERGTGLIRQILGFAHGVSGEPQVIQAKHILREILELVRQTFPRSIELHDEVDGDLWPINANPTQFHQVLLNLCVNARDAMPKGGELTLRATNVLLSEGEAASIATGLKSGEYLEIIVSDSGTGIPHELLERIWEPFFTTKEAGRGTGLGLATVRSIIESHHGSITLQTQIGRGTSFRILFPAEPQGRSGSIAQVPRAIPRGNGELVIVADDDSNVRDMASAVLTEHGYRVLAAASGTEAVALLAPRVLEVKAVITDLDMPNLDGTALTKVVASLNPAIRVILMGEFVEARDGHRNLSAYRAFLPKPFGADALLDTVGRVLNEPAAISAPQTRG